MKRKISIILIFTTIFSTNIFAKTYSLRDAISNATETLCKKIDCKMNAVAIVDIHSDYDKLSEYINDELIHEFTVTLNETVVVERNYQSLKKINKELDYQYSGNVSDETVQSLGYSLGADCIILGELKEDSSGWKLELRALHVETKKVIASWNGNIKKNDKDITFQIKKSAKKEIKKEVKKVKLIDPKAEKDFPPELKNLKKIATMYNTKLTYSDIAKIFIQRFGINYVDGASHVISANFAYEKPDEIKKRKGEYAWTIYASPDNKYTLLVTNEGCILLSGFYDNGQIYGYDSKYFAIYFKDFLYETSINLKAAGKSYSYDELIALNEILLGFEKSSYYDYYVDGSRDFTILTSAAGSFETEGHGPSSKTFIEMCVKAGFYEDNWSGKTILHDAVTLEKYERGPELVKLLINLGFDLNVKTNDKYGQTALMQLITDRYSDCTDEYIDLLLNSGADVNIENDYGETALSIAQHEKNNLAIKLLKEAGAQ